MTCGRVLGVVALLAVAVPGRARAQVPVDSVMLWYQECAGATRPCLGGQIWYRRNGAVRITRSDGRSFRFKLPDTVAIRLTAQLDTIASGDVPPNIPEPGMVCGSIVDHAAPIELNLLKGGFRRRVVHNLGCGTDDETPGQAAASARDYRFRNFEDALMRAVDYNKWMNVKK